MVRPPFMDKVVMIDLRLTIGNIKLKNPVMVASGTFGYGPEYAELVDLNDLGAMVVKGIRMEPTSGNPPPRTVEVHGGLINAIGLPGPGVEGFISTYMPFLRKYDVPVIVNIWGKTLAEYGEVAAALNGIDGVHGLEVNVSCPNIKEGSKAFGSNPEMLYEVVALVKSNTTLPVIPKLAPNVSDITEFACAAESAGADALSLINSYPAMAIDIETRRPVLGNVTGGLSGPCIHPLAVKLVWEAAQSVSIPVIAMGGVDRWEYAVEFLIAGASAVAIGTANFTDPGTVKKVQQGIVDYMTRHGISSLGELTGSIRHA